MKRISRKKFREMMMEVHYRSIADEMVHTHRRKRKTRPFMHEHYPAYLETPIDLVVGEYWLTRNMKSPHGRGCDELSE